MTATLYSPTWSGSHVTETLPPALRVVEAPKVDDSPHAALARFVHHWLGVRGADDPLTLSVAAYGPGGGSAAHPDRRYDPVALEADLWRAVDGLDRFHRVACHVSKRVERYDRSWRKLSWQPQADRMLRSVVPAEWASRLAVTEKGQYLWSRAFDSVLVEAADSVATMLGEEWRRPIADHHGRCPCNGCVVRRRMVAEALSA